MENKRFDTNIKPANAVADKKKPPQRKTKRAPKKITDTYLHNAGLYYLQRYASSRENFRAVMGRKVRKSCRHHTDQNLEECMVLVDELIDKFTNTGLLDDETYTRSMVNSMRRQGKSQKAITAKLQSKGLPREIITRMLETHAAEHGSADPEMRAALIFTRKKKIGPYKVSDKKSDEKALSSMARAGFNYDTARSALKMDLETSETVIRGKPIDY